MANAAPDLDEEEILRCFMTRSVEPYRFEPEPKDGESPSESSEESEDDELDAQDPTGHGGPVEEW